MADNTLTPGQQDWLNFLITRDNTRPRPQDDFGMRQHERAVRAGMELMEGVDPASVRAQQVTAQGAPTLVAPSGWMDVIDRAGLKVSEVLEAIALDKNNPISMGDPMGLVGHGLTALDLASGFPGLVKNQKLTSLLNKKHVVPITDIPVVRNQKEGWAGDLLFSQGRRGIFVSSGSQLARDKSVQRYKHMAGNGGLGGGHTVEATIRPENPLYLRKEKLDRNSAAMEVLPKLIGQKDAERVLNYTVNGGWTSATKEQNIRYLGKYGIGRKQAEDILNHPETGFAMYDRIFYEQAKRHGHDAVVLTTPSNVEPLRQKYQELKAQADEALEQYDARFRTNTPNPGLLFEKHLQLKNQAANAREALRKAEDAVNKRYYETILIREGDRSEWKPGVIAGAKRRAQGLRVPQEAQVYREPFRFDAGEFNANVDEYLNKTVSDLDAGVYDWFLSPKKLFQNLEKHGAKAYKAMDAEILKRWDAIKEEMYTKGNIEDMESTLFSGINPTATPQEMSNAIDDKLAVLAKAKAFAPELSFREAQKQAVLAYAQDKGVLELPWGIGGRTKPITLEEVKALVSEGRVPQAYASESSNSDEFIRSLVQDLGSHNINGYLAPFGYTSWGEWKHPQDYVSILRESLMKTGGTKAKENFALAVEKGHIPKKFQNQVHRAFMEEVNAKGQAAANQLHDMAYDVAADLELSVDGSNVLNNTLIKPLKQKLAQGKMTFGDAMDQIAEWSAKWKEAHPEPVKSLESLTPEELPLPEFIDYHDDWAIAE